MRADGLMEDDEKLLGLIQSAVASDCVIRPSAVKRLLERLDKVELELAAAMAKHNQAKRDLAEVTKAYAFEREQRELFERALGHEAVERLRDYGLAAGVDPVSLAQPHYTLDDFEAMASIREGKWVTCRRWEENEAGFGKGYAIGFVGTLVDTEGEQVDLTVFDLGRRVKRWRVVEGAHPPVGRHELPKVEYSSMGRGQVIECAETLRALVREALVDGPYAEGWKERASMFLMEPGL